MRGAWLGVLVMSTVARADANDVTVHVTGDARARFQIRRPDGWSTLCTIPCTVRTPSDGWYRITSEVALDSRPIGLPKGDEVTLDAHLTTFAARATGRSLMIVGGILLAGGGGALVSAFFWAADLALANLCIRLFANDTCPTYDSSGPAILAVFGFIGAATGGGVLGAGTTLHRPSRLSIPDPPQFETHYEGRRPTWQFPVLTYRW
jgi:hypothetical protein